MAFVKMMDKDGNYAMVNSDLVGNVSNYEKQGYTTDLKKPLDYDKLSPNSIYRTENKQYTQGAYVPQQEINRGGVVTTMGTPKPVETATNNSELLKALIAKTTQPTTQPIVQPVQPTGPNPLIVALKAKIQQQIAQRKQQTQPLRNQSEVTKAQDLRAILERNANRGDRGGMGRQDLLQSQVAGENRLNAIDLQEQNDISNIETEGIVQEGQIEANALRQAIEDQRYNDDIAYRNSRDSVADNRYNTDLALKLSDIDYNRNLTEDNTDYNRLQDTKAEVENTNASKIRDLLATIGQYDNNIQARINEIKNDGDSSNDWELPYYATRRQEKITSQGLDQQGNKLPTAPKQMSSTEALNTWKAYGTATPEIAKILNVPVGAKHTDYIQTQYDISQPKFAPKSSGSGTPSVSQQNADAKTNAQALSGSVQTYLDQWASGTAEGKTGRADQNDMLNYLKSNSGVLTSQGVDVNALIKWVTDNYTWVR
jgi:hypothetical protein